PATVFLGPSRSLKPERPRTSQNSSITSRSAPRKRSGSATSWRARNGRCAGMSKHSGNGASGTLGRAVEAVARKPREQAELGDLASANLLLAYALGRPAAALDPDRLALHECRILDDAPSRAQVFRAMLDSILPEEALVLVAETIARQPAGERLHRPGGRSSVARLVLAEQEARTGRAPRAWRPGRVGGAHSPHPLPPAPFGWEGDRQEAVARGPPGLLRRRQGPVRCRREDAPPLGGGQRQGTAPRHARGQGGLPARLRDGGRR